MLPAFLVLLIQILALHQAQLLWFGMQRRLSHIMLLLQPGVGVIILQAIHYIVRTLILHQELILFVYL